MAIDAGELIVRIKSDLTDLQNGLKNASTQVNTFGASTVAKGILIADAVKSAGKAILDFGIESLKSFGNSQQAVTAFELALKNQGLEVKRTSAEFQAFATQLQQVTTFSDEAILGSGKLLTSFGLTGEELKKTTKSALDLATGLKIDLTTATMILGKAAVGETGTLARYGIVIGDNVPKAQRFEKALEQVNARFSGAAQADMQNVNGKLANMANRFDDVKEKIGKGLLPVFDFWMDKIEKATGLLDRMMGVEKNEAKGRELTIQALQKENNHIIEQAKLRAQAIGGVIRMSEAEMERSRKLTKAIAHEKALLKEELKIEDKREDGAKSRAKAIERFDAEELAAKKKKLQEEGAALDASTASMMAKHQTYAARMIALRQTFNAQDTILLQTYLSEQEQDELTSQITKLNAAQKYGDARRLQEAAVRDAEQKAQEDELKSTKKRNADRVVNFRDTMNFIATLASEKNKVLATIGKASAIATATMDTFAAATKALTIPPPWVGMALAGVVTAAGLANVSKIAGVKLAQGGMILPKDGGTQATLGEAGSAEAVIPLDDKRSEKMLGAALENAGAKKQQSMVVQFNINGQFLEADKAKWQRTLREVLVPAIRRYSEVNPQSSFNRRRGQA